MDSIPDATTVTFFRKRLRKADLIEVIFEHFEQYLHDGGYEARGDQIIDATIGPVPKQRNSRSPHQNTVPVQGSGRLTANLSPAEPLTAA